MRAFSLVELSIVLVILGLLTGGILAGQSLIRAAELRAVGTEYQRFYTGLQSFRDKYGAIPGDMRNATAFWGKLSAYCNSDPGTALATGTCNGNGDGVVTGVGVADVSITREEPQAWRQLSLAGLIEGDYSGVVAASAGVFDNPTSRLSMGEWRMRTMGNLTGAVAGTLVSTFALDYGNVFEVFASGSGNFILTPAEGWNIDTKMDDGKPAQGKFIIRGWEFCTDAAARTDTSADYNLSDDDKLCNVAMFRNL